MSEKFDYVESEEVSFKGNAYGFPVGYEATKLLRVWC